MIKFVVSLICGLIDLSIYEISSNNTTLSKTIIFASFHVISLTMQWSISTTSTYIVLLVCAHLVHWAWFPNASDLAVVVCLVIAVQTAWSGDTFENGSMLFTTLSCAAADALSKNIAYTI